MKLVTYLLEDEARAGYIEDETVVDLGSSLLDLLADGLEGHDGNGQTHPLSSVRLLAPLQRPGKILACAGNYQEHIKEGGGTAVDKTRAIPRLFSKPSTTVIGPDEPLRLPSLSREVDWELELAAVLGPRGSIAGYVMLNDVSARTIDWNVDRDVVEWDRFFDWLNGKWFDGFAPMGPWIATPDEIPDPQALHLELRVNDEVMQSASTAQMIFGVDELVEFASRFTTLEPGDVIATGTPAGVGYATRRFLEPGDVMEGAIEGLGILRTPVVA
jgi:2-keto-4-pentenoate hydratase/2-oxohepta-3-ene-1,7-dioic acid hydratase in catechol pathway